MSGESRTRWLLAAILVSAVSLSPASAQQSSGAVEAVEEVVVTGSRIKRSGTTTPVPVTILGVEDFEMSTGVEVAEVLNDLPALGDTVTNSNTNFNAGTGLNLLDLRRLGTNRTLVLINGRRHVGSQLDTTAVDINNVPPSLVERVEVMTGSASAVYGADAVSGVVNIVLRDSFEGLEFDTRFGQSEEGDGDRRIFNLTAGRNFEGGGNAAFNLSWDTTEVVEALDRDFGVQVLFGPNLDSSGPDQVLYEGITYNTWGRGGLVYRGEDASGNAIDMTGIYGAGPIAFDTDSNPRVADLGTVIDLGNFGIGGTDVFSPRQWQEFQQPGEKLRFTGLLTYPLAPEHDFTLDIGFLSSEVTPGGQAPTTFAGPIRVRRDNPFITPELGAVMDSAGAESIFVARTFAENGEFRTLYENTTFRLVPGIQGQVGDWDYEAYYSYGRTQADRTLFGMMLSNLDQAADAVLNTDGEIVCRDQSTGCIPFNMMGVTDQLPGATGYSFGDHVLNAELEQQVANFTATSSDFMPALLPAGAMGIAFGLEHRRESSETRFGGGEQTPNFFRGFGLQIPAGGSYHTTEAFAELLAPVLVGAPLAQELNLEAAVRAADYSTVGRTTSWKFGLDWRPSDDIRLRANLSEAVRAPNIGELFAPSQANFMFLKDPCDSDRINDVPGRAAACESLGIPPGGFSSKTDALTARVDVSGNPGLDPEESETLTFGIVYTPDALPNLSLTADFWDIVIKDAINTFDSQTILDGCTDLGSTDNDFCRAIERGSDFNIISIQNQQVNVSKFEANGVDIEARYSWDFSGGDSLDLSVIATVVDKLDFFVIPANPSSKLEEIGELGDPETMVNLRATYSRENLKVSALARYMSSMVFSNRDPAGFRSPNSTGSIAYLDLTARYAINDIFTVYGGIDNALGEDPPLVARDQLTTIAGGAQTGIFDWVGRSYYIGLNASFGD